MQYSKTLRRSLQVLLLVGFIFAADMLLGLFLAPLNYGDYFQRDCRRMEQDGQNPDLIFIGASRVYRTFVPEIFEETLGLENVINAGGSSQPISGSYYQLKDLLSRFQPKYVVIGVAEDALFCGEPVTQAKLLASEIAFPENLQYVFHEFSPEEYPYFFSQAYRFGNNFNLTRIQSIWKEKKDFYKGIDPSKTSRSEYYADHGFVYSYSTMELGNIPVIDPIVKRDGFADHELEYLDKMIDLCKSKGIKVFLVTGPTSMARIAASPDYQFSHEWYCRYAEEKGIPYWNLNYLKGREEFLPDSRMHDYNHVNGEGAEIISRIYADILQAEQNGESTRTLFYEDKDQLMRDTDRIFSLDYEMVQEGSRLELRITSYPGPGITPYYQVSFAEDGQEAPVILQDFTLQSSFSVEIPENAQGELLIKAAAAPDDPKPAFQRIRISAQ